MYSAELRHHRHDDDSNNNISNTVGRKEKGCSARPHAFGGDLVGGEYEPCSGPLNVECPQTGRRSRAGVPVSNDNILGGSTHRGAAHNTIL